MQLPGLCRSSELDSPLGITRTESTGLQNQGVNGSLTACLTLSKSLNVSGLFLHL